jgi:hypothetical protein
VKSPWINYEDLIFVESDLIGRGKTASVYRAIWMVAEVAVKVGIFFFNFLF